MLRNKLAKRRCRSRRRPAQASRFLRPHLERLEDRRVLAAPPIWQFQGPAPILEGQVEGMQPQLSPVSGAAHAVVPHPTNSEMMYVASVNGGIWRTDNATSTSGPSWLPQTDNLLGVWGLSWDSTWRFPVFATFLVISGAFCIWPAQKNLGTLLSCSAAVMVATQFWHGYGGGLYMAWFLPLALLTVFRPNLEDRVALSVLGEGWFRSRKPQLRRVDRAA